MRFFTPPGSEDAGGPDDVDLEPPMPETWYHAVDEVVARLDAQRTGAARPSTSRSMMTRRLIVRLKTLWRQHWLEMQLPQSPDVCVE